MTRLVRTPLGTAPGSGSHATDQTRAFKRQLRSVLPAADGAWLVTVSDHGRLTVEAVHDPGTGGAGDWAGRAAELAPAVWDTLAARRVGRGR